MTTSSTSPEPVAGNYFVSAYPPFSCWSPHATADYVATLNNLPEDPERPFGLYVHIPFCVQRCHFCYYLSHDTRLGEAPDYLDALILELGLYRSRAAFAGRSPSFVYFGGGTPSLLSLPQLERLLGELQEIAGWDDVEEATFECAPKSVTEDKLTLLRDAGITRLSLGVQQLDDDVLQRNGRVHGVKEIVRAYELIHRVGFDVVNVDLIVGLVGETEQTFRNSLERVIAMGPESVTIYQLEIPPNTPLYHELLDGTASDPPPDWDTKRARLGRAFELLEAEGYSLASAYCAVRDPERHRFVYQDAQYRGADLLGIGASSFSYLGGFHQQNQTRLEDYVSALARGELPLGRVYELDPVERMVRELVLQMKLGRVDLQGLREKYGADPLAPCQGTFEKFRAKGWLRFSRNLLTLTRDGLLRVDRMIPELYLPQHRVEQYSQPTGDGNSKRTDRCP